MAHVQLFRDDEGTPRLIVNGLDLTHEVIADTVRVVSTGSDEASEVCIDMRIALSRLDLDGHVDIDAALLVGAATARMADSVSARRGAAS